MRLLSLAFAFALVASASGVARSAEQAPRAEPNAQADRKRPSDAQVKKLLIEESVAAYDGNCPCPYSRARNGSRCGKRSAYTREGGAAPLCFERDVTTEMVQAYRDTHPDE